MSGSPIIQGGKFVGIYSRSICSYTGKVDTKFAYSAKDMLREHIEGLDAYDGALRKNRLR